MPLVELNQKAVTETAPEPKGLTVRLARVEDAQAITATYERVFGKSGIKAAGHEAYPAPEVFSAAGVQHVIADQSRLFIVAESDGAIAGGMIINLLSPHNCEFCCVAVDPAYRNLGISPRLLSFARSLAEASVLTVNSTEIVTHSVLSQTAHHGVSYGKITGFAFCQYPRVFFAKHPESVLWVTEIQGRVAERLKKAQFTTTVANDSSHQTPQPEEELLLEHLKMPRQIFVPAIYRPLVSNILSQFEDTIDYQIPEGRPTGDCAADGITGDTSGIQMEFCGDDPYGYLKLPSMLEQSWQNSLSNNINALKDKGKRFIQAKIPANAPSAAIYAQYLQQKGFVFLGLLPLWSFHPHPDGQPIFDDLLVMQWLDAHTIANNPLPGETDSVVKLYGYPANLSGRLLKLIRKELSALGDCTLP